MNPRELLISGSKELGFTLTIEQVNTLFIYLAELNKWNNRMNLTAITEVHEMVIKHVLDSLTYIKGFNPSPGLRLLDMGTGAGFPALPIKILCPEIDVTMVESVKKKASFLRHIIRTLKLSGTDVIDKRMEELPTTYRSSSDVITARAFADMSSAISAGAPFLKTGGHIVLSRGPEENIGEHELKEFGVILERKIGLTLPHSDYKRAIWILKKIE